MQQKLSWPLSLMNRFCLCGLGHKATSRGKCSSRILIEAVLTEHLARNLGIRQQKVQQSHTKQERGEQFQIPVQ